MNDIIEKLNIKLGNLGLSSEFAHTWLFVLGYIAYWTTVLLNQELLSLVFISLTRDLNQETSKFNKYMAWLFLGNTDFKSCDCNVCK